MAEYYVVKSMCCKRVCVVMHVSARDIRRGVQVMKPGKYLVRGWWYGDDELSLKTCGKIEGEYGKVPCRKLCVMRDRFKVKRLMRRENYAKF